MSETVSIEGLDRADVLRALYNRAQPQGMGFLQYDPEPMSRALAEELLASTDTFDYLYGRVMKVRLRGEELDPALYDRDNGSGAAADVVRALRDTRDPACERIIGPQRSRALRNAMDAAAVAGTPTRYTREGGVPVIELGLPTEAGEAALRAIYGEDQ